MRDGGRLVAVLDTWDEDAQVACEVDGDVEYLHPRMAPEGAGRAVIAEKQREDLPRSCVAGLARYGCAVAADPVRLRPVLLRAGLRPAGRPPSDAGGPGGGGPRHGSPRHGSPRHGSPPVVLTGP